MTFARRYTLLFAASGSGKSASRLQDVATTESVSDSKGVNVTCHGLGTTQAYGDVNVNVSGNHIFTDFDKKVTGKLELDAYSHSFRVFKDTVEFDG